MNGFGICYGVWAPITNETPGSPLVYGPPTVFDGMRQADLSLERSGDPLYGDNVIKEHDNGIVGGTFTMSATGVTLAKEAAILSLVKEGTAPNEYYDETGDPSAPGGFGYIRNVSQNGVKKWIANWIHKLYFAKNEETGATKEGAIAWSSPVYEGVLCGVVLDASGKERFRRRPVEYTSYAAAKAYLDGIAGVGLSTVATPTATPAAGAVVDGSTVVLATTTTDATIYYTTDGSAPTTGSMVYSVPLTITGAITIKAMAAKEGMANSAVLSAAYTITA